MKSQRSASRALVGAPRAAIVLLAAASLAGCATKGDLRDVRDEMARQQQRQDESSTALQRQNRQLADAIEELGELLVRTRGDLGNQLVQIEQQLIQVQELAGQSQRRLAELREQIAERAVQMQRPPALPTDSAGGGGDAEALYAIGMENLQREASSTARQAFEEIVTSHQDDPRAPDAQYQLAETYVLDRDYDRALEELERVVEMYPSSARAPSALYRAGVIAAERGNIGRARGYFERVRAGYPNSDEAERAAEELRRLRS